MKKGFFIKSQITLFIVIGMMVFILTAIIIYINNMNFEAAKLKELSKRYSIENNLNPVKRYTESCIRQVALPIIAQIAEHGGTINPENYKDYYGNKINYLCLDDTGSGCKNTILLKSSMEKEISEHIQKELPKCVNLEIFKNQGYSVRVEDIAATASITEERIIINISYPIFFSLDNITRKISDFNAEINSPLGRLFLVSLEISSKESRDGYFDQVKFMKKDGYGITIEKHKPYPDIVYLLKKDGFSFNFALQGKDTSSQPGKYLIELQKITVLGCCHIIEDDSCYTNADAIECNAKSGFYDPNPNCLCSQEINKKDGLNDNNNNNNNNNNNQSIKDDLKGCTIQSETGLTKKANGESWCEYDGIAGYGFDNVGGRHYMKYCVDDNVYTEECRDFREELCTQEKGPDSSGSPRLEDTGKKEITKAICRPNRWVDCYSCTTENCCNNTEFRDCTWLSNTTIKNRCAPFVPPGFRYWENAGREACSLGFEEKYCTGLSCGNIWLNDAAKSCYMRGDCGNYWNTEGKVTYEGFFHTDLAANSDITAYDIKKQANIAGIDDIDNYAIDLGIDNRKSSILSNEIAPATGNFAKVVSSVYSILNAVSSLNVASELNGINSANVLEVAICEPWKAPNSGDDCGKCGNDKDKPCSEYLCKSLGQKCIYEEKEGFPECKKAAETQTEELIITPNSQSLPQGYELEKETLEINKIKYSGYKVVQELKPYQLFSIGVNTTGKSICREHFAPKSNIVASGGYYFGEPVFSMGHKITLRVPAKAEFPERLSKIFNATSAYGISDEIIKLKSVGKNSNTDPIAKLYTALTKKSLTDPIPAVGERLFNALLMMSSESEFYKSAAEVILDKFEKGGYYIFVYCEDESGKYAKEPIFFDVTISNNDEDNSSPLILSFNPENASSFAKDAKDIPVRFYLDEPGECRYSLNDTDYYKMDQSMNCANSRYDMSPELGGSYLCTRNINTTELSSGIYIRCSDNPRKIKSYEFTLNWTEKKYNQNKNSKDIDNSALSGIDDSASTKITIDNNLTLISAPEYLISKYIVFNISTDRMLLSIYMDDKMECKSYANGTKNIGLYEKSDKIILGEQRCNFWFDRPGYINNSKFNSTDNIIQDNSSEIIMQRNDYDMVYTNIICEEKIPGKRNLNTKSYYYSLNRSSSLDIVSFGPTGEINKGRLALYVETTKSEEVECRYYRDLSFGLAGMNNNYEDNSNAFYVILENNELNSGTNEFFISCIDAYGNTAEQNIEFYIID